MYNSHPYVNQEDTFTNCYISNLPDGSTDNSIRNIFSRFRNPILILNMEKEILLVTAK